MGSASNIFDKDFSQKELDQINSEVAAELRSIDSLQKSLSEAVVTYKISNNIGFNELCRRMEISDRVASKLLNGENVSFQTIAKVGKVLGKTAYIGFR